MAPCFWFSPTPSAPLLCLPVSLPLLHTGDLSRATLCLQLYSLLSSTEIPGLKLRPPIARPPSLFSGYPHLDGLKSREIPLFSQMPHVSSGFSMWNWHHPPLNCQSPKPGRELRSHLPWAPDSPPSLHPSPPMHHRPSLVVTVMGLPASGVSTSYPSRSAKTFHTRHPQSKRMIPDENVLRLW